MLDLPLLGRSPGNSYTTSYNRPKSMSHTISSEALWQGLVIAAVFSAVLALMQLGLPLYSMQIFDRVIPSNSLATLTALTLLMAALIVCNIILDGSRALILGRLSSRIDQALHRRLPATALDDRSADLFLRDIDTVRNFVSSPLATAVLDVPWSTAFLAAMFFLHPILGWLTVGSALTILLLGSVAHFCTRRNRATASNLSQTMLRVLQMAYEDRVTSLAMGFHSAALLQLNTLCSRRISALGKTYERQSWIEAVCRGFRNAMQVIILGSAAILAMSHDVGIGTIVASSMLFARAIAPIERIGAGFNVVAQFVGAWCRLSPPVHSSQPMTKRLSLPAITGQIKVERLTFGVVGRQQPVLKQVSFSLEAGQVLAIVGPEAAGKSTLAKLIVGALKPSAGSVRFDGSNIADFDPTEIGCQIGFVSGSLPRTNCTVSEMISRHRSSDPCEVVRAAKLAGAHSMIQRLPSGYQTRFDEVLCLQSAGERQRLALARAYYGAPRLIVLDEPTAFLDDGGERDLMAAVEELKSSGCTVILISRFQGFLHSADYLMMLDSGEVRLFADQTNIQSFRAPRLASSQD